MTEPTWQMLAQLGSLGPITWLVYRMIPVLKDAIVAFNAVAVSFKGLQDRIESHCAEQAELMRKHEELETQARADEQRWRDYMLRKLNGAPDSPAQGH